MVSTEPNTANTRTSIQDALRSLKGPTLMTSFMDKLSAKWAEGNMLCVGLDSTHSRIPELVRNRMRDRVSAVSQFNVDIVTAVGDQVCAFKPNIAFYPRELRRALADTCDFIRSEWPDVPIILDFKRADIGATNAGYVEEGFGEFGADAGTVNPYFGEEALKPFLERSDKGIIILCRTSNPGAGELQDKKIAFESVAEISDKLAVDEKFFPLEEWTDHPHKLLLVPFYQLVAIRAAHHWNKHGNCALVVGATAPTQLAAVRKLTGDMPILVPGVGTQGGDLDAVLKAGLTSNNDGLIINASSSVTFASNGPDYVEAALAEVKRINTAIRNFL